MAVVLPSRNSHEFAFPSEQHNEGSKQNDESHDRNVRMKHLESSQLANAERGKDECPRNRRQKSLLADEAHETGNKHQAADEHDGDGSKIPVELVENDDVHEDDSREPVEELLHDAPPREGLIEANLIKE